MIYKVSLNGKIYEVEVEKGEAVIKAKTDYAEAQCTVTVKEASHPVIPDPDADKEGYRLVWRDECNGA